MNIVPLQVNGLSKRYAANTVLAGVDLTLAAGEVLCIPGQTVPVKPR